MRVVLRVAWSDGLRWLRSPALVIATLVPAAGMALLMVALTFAVGRQPVALVLEGSGPQAQRVIDLISESDGFFLVRRSPSAAAADLRAQRVAAVITVPAGFDQALVRHQAQVGVLINNVDLDFSDDVRRSVTEAVVEIDAPTLATLGESDLPPGVASGQPNPYRVDVAETDLRTPDTSFLSYQLVPVLALLALTAGSLVTALAMASERELGVLRLVGLAPARRLTVVLGRLLGGALTSTVLVTVVALALSTRLSPPPGRLPAMAALLGLLSLSAVGLGVIVGSLTRRVASAVLVGVNVATASFLLGGGFTTVAFLPSWVQALARATPTYYGIDALRSVLFYESTPTLGRDVGFLVLGAAASLVVGAVTLARGSHR